MYEIHLSNNQASLQIRKSLIRQIVSETLQAERVASAEIVVALVDDATIHTVNREHLQHDYPTDVISFLYESTQVDDPTSVATPQTDSALLRGAGRHLDGELVVSSETAIREADRYGWNPQDELRLYIVHGILHLCGYDDQSESEQLQMRAREQTILNLWGLHPHYNSSEDCSSATNSPETL